MVNKQLKKKRKLLKKIFTYIDAKKTVHCRGIYASLIVFGNKI